MQSLNASSPSPSKKKVSKDRDKRKSQTGNYTQSDSSSEKDKSSPSTESREYAGLSPDTIKFYDEQNEVLTCEYDIGVTDEVHRVLAEDLTYKLRYIIDESLLQARLQSRNVITSRDIEETFSNLRLDRVLGAPSNPSWIPDQNLLSLDDPKINLVEISEIDESYGQKDPIQLEKSWISERPSTEEDIEIFKNYFDKMCRALISNNAELRQMALQDISENSAIGPIVEWFYHFTYILLTTHTTDDILTLRALSLLETLENSPLPYQCVSSKQLKLLFRVILQRLTLGVNAVDVLKPLCYVLSLLCLREPLKKMTIEEVNSSFEKFESLLTLLLIIYYLGCDGVKGILIPNSKVIFNKLKYNQDGNVDDALLAIYGIICRSEIECADIHRNLYSIYQSMLVPFWKLPCNENQINTQQVEMDFVKMKSKLIKSRRNVEYKSEPCAELIEEIFDLPRHPCEMKRIVDDCLNHQQYNVKKTHVTLGKTSLMLPELQKRQSRQRTKLCYYSLMSCTI